MLPFIGSIASSWCGALVRHQTTQEDLEGGILTVVGLRMPRRRSNISVLITQETNDDKTAPDEASGTEEFDKTDDNGKELRSSTATDDMFQFRETLSRSSDALCPQNSDQLQFGRMRRYSYIPTQRRLSSMRCRLTMEEISAELKRRASENPKPTRVSRIDLVSGLILFPK